MALDPFIMALDPFMMVIVRSEVLEMCRLIGQILTLPTGYDVYRSVILRRGFKSYNNKETEGSSSFFLNP